MDYLLYNLDTIQAAPEDIQLLDAHELEQYTKRGDKYLITRVLLKKELARRSGTPAHEISFDYNEHGKPSWANQHFNISHSASWLCLAFHSAEIGVDIQQIRPVRKMDSIAPRIMNPQQLEYFHTNGSTVEDFFTCWCIAEALVKLHGATIWEACNYPCFYKQGRVMIPENMAEIGIQLFSPAPGFCGAIATRS